MNSVINTGLFYRNIGGVINEKKSIREDSGHQLDTPRNL